MKQNPRTDKHPSQSPVVFLYCRQQQVTGRMILYDYFLCEDPRHAKEFLDQSDNPSHYHYLVVLTPVGMWGKDHDGIYQLGNVNK